VTTSNVIEAILGCEKLKWDAVFKLFGWLCDPREGHGLGSSFLRGLTFHVFGQEADQAESKLEFMFHDESSEGGKWPDLAIAIPGFESPTHLLLLDDVDRRAPGNQRKLTNLESYLKLGTARFPDAITRVVVLTNAPSSSGLQPLYDRLGAEAVAKSTQHGWSLLPLQLTANWVAPIGGGTSEKMRWFLSDYAEWAALVGRRWQTSA
jgi:hypothetical protein